MKKNLFVLLAVFVLFSLALAGCASPTPEPVTITIDVTEYAFTPNRLELKVGQQVTLNLKNSGHLAHEIMFGRDVMMMDDHPNSYQHDMFKEAGVEPTVTGMDMMEEEEEHEEGHSGFMVLLNKTGDQATITFTVTQKMVGEWGIGCFELDGVHYTQGMRGTLVVSR